MRYNHLMCMECVTLGAAIIAAWRNPSAVRLVWQVIKGWFV
jgi:hypothetical protein